MFHVESFLQTLPIMLYGMGGIFVVIGVIALLVKLLQAIFPNKEDPQKTK